MAFTNSNHEAFPLQWPQGQERTRYPETSRFKLSMADARDELIWELDRMGAMYPVLSTNVELRRDGLPYANQKEPHDSGVAVYFKWRGKQMTFACDRWDRVRDNIRAIGKTIEAIRGIERWGASDMMERAFSAFEALPSPDNIVALSCWQILDIEPHSDRDVIDRAYRSKARSAHPDGGGTREEWDDLQSAYQQALAA